jgi:hypothetical protein
MSSIFFKSVLKLLDRTVYSVHWAVKGQALLDIIIAVNGIMKGSPYTFTVHLGKGYVPAYCVLKHLKNNKHWRCCQSFNCSRNTYLDET